jgi:quinoprotein glucose dehydrogenase
LRWSWDPIPQDPDDPAYGGWRGALAHGTGTANAWSILAADPARDLVFVPTGSAAPDYYGALRLGDNRYANSIVALRASTGKLVWSFQTVHHDLWDYDNAAPPALVTLIRGGLEVPAVVQATKTGMLFVLHRETGEPLFPVEDRAVPASRIPGEEASPTQPFTIGIAPLSPHRLRLDEVWGVTEADRAACRAMIEPLRNEGGGKVWEVPLGSIEALVPAEGELPAEWGSVSLGGPIATAGGVVFIGATLDRSLKAYDVETGEELWRGVLPASGKATPMTYQMGGVQYVAIAVGGGGAWGEGDWVVVFRLRR